MTIVGLHGYAQTGKDTAAAHLVDKFGWTRMAFADAIRETLYALNPLIDGFRLQMVVDSLGWEAAKKHTEIRGLLQRMGTEAARSIYGNDFWVDLLERKIVASKDGGINQNIVVTDVRFANEAERIKSLGGIVVRVVRPGVRPLNGHPSESGIPESLIDRTIVNDGGLDRLHAAIEEIAMAASG